MRFLRYILPRFAVAFLLVLAGYYLLVIHPYQSRQRTMREHVEAVTRMDRALNDIRQRIDVLPHPAAIKLAETDSAKQQAQKLKEATVITNIEYPKRIGLIPNPNNNVSMNQFNSVIRNPEHWKDLKQVELTLRSTDSLIEHQAAVMKALANLMQYDPRVDLKSGSKEVLSQQIGFAQQGLEVTLQRLQSSPKYNDSGYEGLINNVEQAQDSSENLTKVLDSDSEIESAKQTFFSEIDNIQRSIRDNRENFWSAQREIHLKSLLQARQTVRPHLLLLSNIKLD